MIQPKPPSGFTIPLKPISEVLQHQAFDKLSAIRRRDPNNAAVNYIFELLEQAGIVVAIL